MIMNAAFIHELQFFEDETGGLYLRGYNDSYWARYLKYFDKLYVIGRKHRTTADKVKGYDRFDGENLVYVEVPGIYSMHAKWANKSKANRVISDLVDRVDCVITRQPGVYSEISIAQCRKKNVPYLIELVGCPWDSLWNHSLKGKLAAPMTTFKTKQLVRNAPFVIYVTNEFLQKRYPTSGTSTNCSNVTLPPSDERILEDRITRIRTHPMDKFVIGTTAATNVRYKGQQYVIEALGLLKKRGINKYEYQLLGGGDPAYLREIASKYDVLDMVKFMGSKSHEEVFTWLDSIDLYVQPSRQEGLPRALIEAMSRGLPCFAANTGGIPELLDSSFIFSNTKKNIEEICQILESFSKETMVEQSMRNFEHADWYDREKIETRREKIFRAFIEERTDEKKALREEKTTG